MNKAKENCKRGHPLSGDNLYVWKDKRQCRTCRRERLANMTDKTVYIRTYLEKNPGINHFYATKAPRRLWVDAVKRDTPCKDCGGYFAHYQMQFDHVPERGAKQFAITPAIKNCIKYPDDVFYAEVAKCDIVCGNCHATRTYFRAKEKIKSG